jgi:Asp-tRNA(Asn)/Glu-tRNA(Gln) amidotransferase A subunit family amidase
VTARVSFLFATLALLLSTASPASATTIGDGFRLEEATIAGTERALRTRRISCAELVAGYLRRIDRYEPKVNALIAVNPAARTRARALDARLRRSGRPVGPLHCVPVLVKDNYDTAELPTTASSRSLEGSQPPDDAESVARLHRAGAIVLAKANLTEFALTGISFGSLGGQTRNPYDLTRTPGGSSGGTGAGLAVNLGLAGTGTDTVNSIRSPASANAVVGIRPTAGLVSRDGVVPLSSTQDAAGPLARTVPSAAALLGVMAGYDGRDPITARGVGRREGSYVDGLRPRALRGARVGVLQNFLGTDPELHGPVNRIVDRAARDLRRRGARVQRVALPGGVTADALIASLDVQRFEIRAALNRYLGSFDAPRRSLTEVIASGGVDARFLPTLRAADALVNGPSEPEYHARLARISALRDQVLALMADRRLDALVYPQQKRLVVPIGQDQVDRNGILAAVTGFPSVAVPAGFSPPTATAPRGVPVGIEMLGRPFTEQSLLSLARDYERATRHRRPPASTP